MMLSGVPSPLFKPNGSPTLIANSLSASMLLYVFDTGTGLYRIVQDCSPTHHLNPDTYYGSSPNYNLGSGQSSPFDPRQANFLPASSGYGTAIHWGGSAVDSAEPGGGAIIDLFSSDDLRTAINMASRGAGEGCTIFATHMQTGNTSDGLICGRGCDLDHGIDICAIRVSSGGMNSSGTKLLFSWSYQNDASHGASIESTDACGMNVLCTTVVTLHNTASGVTDIKMYVNGVLQAQTTGTAVYDVPGNTASFEDQWQTGAYFHVYGPGQQFNVFAGYVFQSGMANRAWSGAEAAAFAASPYQLLSF